MMHAGGEGCLFSISCYLVLALIRSSRLLHSLREPLASGAGHGTSAPRACPITAVSCSLRSPLGWIYRRLRSFSGTYNLVSQFGTCPGQGKLQQQNRHGTRERTKAHVQLGSKIGAVICLHEGLPLPKCSYNLWGRARAFARRINSRETRDQSDMSLTASPGSSSDASLASSSPSLASP